MSTPIRVAFAALLAAAVPLGGQVAADDRAPGRIDRLVIFGDSLSDPGNAFDPTGALLENGESSTGFPPIPSRNAPYLIGARVHFTNGSTWIEQLADDFGLHSSAGPAMFWPGVFTKYAVGGARARDTDDFGFDLGEQVEQFLNDFRVDPRPRGRIAPRKALYVLWIGGDDLRDALDPRAVDPSGIISDAIEATGSAIAMLHGAGARSFLVLNLPDISKTPAIRALDMMVPGAAQAAQDLSAGYNDQLRTALEQLRRLPGIRIVHLDVFTILNDVVGNPDLVGLTNVEDSCIVPGGGVEDICRTPDEYLFWDFIHPTAKAHGYLGERAQARLQRRFDIPGPAVRNRPVM